MREPYNAYSDRQLLDLIRHEDIHAFEALFDKYWYKSYQSGYKILKDSDQCKAIVHDVFLDLWKRRRNIQIDNPEAYIKTAVRFRVITYMKRRKVIPLFELFESCAASPYRPENKLFEKETLSLIKSWIKVLPPRRREIFIKHFFNQLSTSEIAEELSISQKTVQNQLTSTVHALYSRLSHLMLMLPMVF